MLLVAENGRESELLAIFNKWDVNAVVVGAAPRRGALAGVVERRTGSRYSRASID